MKSQSEKTLIISDIHVPYQDNRALSVALDFAKDEGVSTIIINGDFMDCAMISKFDKLPSTPSFADEVKVAKNLLSKIRNRFPQAKIIYRLGNHEERLELYLMRQAEEVARLGVVTIASILQADKFGIHVVERRQQHIMLGKLAVLHGHEVSSAASINIANSVLRKVMHNVVVGHWHRRQNETLKTYKGDYIGCWVVGCLCDLNPHYMPVNQWQHGFAIVSVRKSGNFQVYNYVIVEGEVL
ncbi:MAG: metallophosphoesterase family protein [Candidatus Bilamarchaeaceae archaeon]